MLENKIGGVWVPALTPFKQDLSLNQKCFVDHCKWLLEQGVDGLAVFGTTSEANSLSIKERMSLLDALIDEGIPANKLMPGVGCCAIEDTVSLASHATNRSCAGVLVLPPFYYKGVSEQGLINWFSEVIESVDSDNLRVFLYHIPPVTQVPISLGLIEGLLKQYQNQIVGLKDSGGEWAYTSSVLGTFPELTTFAGSEIFLLDILRGGGAGCITASGNVNPAGIRLVYEQWRSDQADGYQNTISTVRYIIQSYPMIPALKAICADYYDDVDWAIPRPPLTRLNDSDKQNLLTELSNSHFNMKDNRAALKLKANNMLAKGDS